MVYVRSTGVNMIFGSKVAWVAPDSYSPESPEGYVISRWDYNIDVGSLLIKFIHLCI